MDGVASCSYNSNERLSRLHSHNKKVIKHALRQQAKRRRKNTTIASGNSGMLPRIIVKTLPPKPPEELTEECYRASTGKEILASIHGFSVKKPRKRTNKKLSMAAQLEQTKEGCIDLETPDSILVNTNIKALLNNDTFRLLPLLYQHKLVQLLPDVDRPNLKDPSSKLSMSGLSNEFFTRACLEWRERLAEGEFTPENQQKLKTEAEKERSKLDPWKIKHFEPMWGDKGFPNNNNNIKLIVPTSTSSRPSLKTTIKLKPLTTICNKHTKSPPMLKKRLRTVGAVTRAITSYREENNSADEAYDSPDKPIIPDLLPIKSITSKFQCEIQRPEIVQVHSSDSRESDDAKEEVDPLQITDPFSGFDNDNAAMSVSDVIDNSERTTSEKRSRSESPTEESEIKLKRHSPEIFPCDPELFTVKSDSPYPETLSEKDSEQDNLVLPDPISVPDIIPDQDTSSLKDSSSVKDVPMSEQETCSQLAYDSENNVNSSDLFDKNIQEDDSESKQEFIDINTHLVCSVSPEHSLDDKDKVFPDDKEVELQRIEELMTHHKDSSDTEENNHLADVIESLHTGLIQGAKLPNSLILHQDSIILNKEDDTDGPNSDNNFEKFEASVKESDLVTFGENVNMNTENEIDTNEDRFIDAEIFVLESGAIASQDLNSSETNTERESAKDEINDDEDTEGDADEMQVALFAAAVARGEDSCWDVVDSSTEKLLAEVPLHSLESVNVPVSMNVTNNDEQGSGDVEVIPMKEELEVRLEEGAFPVPNDWSYVLKMDSEMVAAALSGNNLPENSESSCITESENKVQYPEYSTANQVKLELEVTLTPETVTSNDNMVTSTVGSSTNCTDSSTLSAKSTVTTIIPPTTIVCLPSVVAPSNPHVSQLAVNNITNILRSNVVASSSALPLLALSTNQPIRAVSQHTTTTKIKSNKSNRESQVLSGNTSSNRSRSSNKPPPGAVNLERSYQICQAVIQNSPNRDQLRCQLKPPPSLLAAQNTNATATNKKVTTQYGAVSSSRNTANKTFVNLHPSSNAQPKQGMLNQTKQINARGVQFQQRQQSPPVVLRHVFTSSQGIPVTMAVLPQTQPAIQPGVVEAPAGPVGQYILVRNNMMEHHTAPRASSAPPSNSQAQIFGSGVSGMVTTNQITTGIANPRLRPASVDVERPQQQQVLLYGPQQGPHPGIQAISKRNKMYGDVSMENYSISADNVAAPGSCQPQIMKNVNQRQAIPHSDSSCACNLKAMIVCKNCGAFCHDDCIGPSKLCVTCLIR